MTLVIEIAAAVALLLGLGFTASIYLMSEAEEAGLEFPHDDVD